MRILRGISLLLAVLAVLLGTAVATNDNGLKAKVETLQRPDDRPPCNADPNCAAMYSERCYPDLVAAIEAFQAKNVKRGTIYITGNSTAATWASVTKDLTIMAGDCEDRPVVTASFPYNKGYQRGIINLDTDDISLQLAGFDMTLDPNSGIGSAVRSGNWSGLGFVAQDMRFYGFNMNSYGGAVYLNEVQDLFIDGNTEFHDNLNSDVGEGGGAGMYVSSMPEGSQVSISGTYRNNYVQNQEGGGAGIYIHDVNTEVFVNGIFSNNFAVGGSAFYVLECHENCILHINGLYTDNGAMRGTILVQQTEGIVNLPGKYMNNIAHLGAVLRLNRVKAGVVTLSGLFFQNKAYLLDLGELVKGRQPKHDRFSKGGVVTFWSLNGTMVLSGDFFSNSAMYTGGVFDIDEEWHGTGNDNPVTPTVKFSGRFFNNIADNRGGVGWIKRLDGGAVLEMSGQFASNEAGGQPNIFFIHDNKLKVTDAPNDVDLSEDPILIVPSVDPDWRDGWGKFADAVEYVPGDADASN